MRSTAFPAIPCRRHWRSLLLRGATCAASRNGSAVCLECARWTTDGNGSSASSRLGVHFESWARRLFPGVATEPPHAVLEAVRASLSGQVLAGTPEALVEELRAYERAGLQELMIDWFDPDDFEGLQVLAEEVMPRLSG